MEIKKIVLGERSYEFVNESRSTRHGFAHDTKLFCNDYEVAKATCHYLNRTWECYRYQTVMKCAVRNLKEDRKNYLLNEFKNKNGYARMTSKRTEDFNKNTLYKDNKYKEYVILYSELDR